MNQNKRKKSMAALLLLLLFMAGLYGCGAANQGIEETLAEDIIEETQTEGMMAEAQEMQYPVMFELASEGNIELAVYSEGIFCDLMGGIWLPERKGRGSDKPSL